MDLIDSHAHVDVSDYDSDREEMLLRAQEAGVGTILAIGNGPEIEKLGAAVRYAESHDWIYASAGIHPHEAKLATDAHYAELERLAPVAQDASGRCDGFSSRRAQRKTAGRPRCRRVVQTRRGARGRRDSIDVD